MLPRFRHLVNLHTRTLTIDEEEKCSRLVCHSPSNERLSGSWGAKEQNPPGGFHANGPEELGVTQGELHHLHELVYMYVCACKGTIEMKMANRLEGNIYDY